MSEHPSLLRSPPALTLGEPIDNRPPAFTPGLFVPAWRFPSDPVPAPETRFEAFDPSWPRIPIDGADGGIIVVEPRRTRLPLVAWATPIAMTLLVAIGLIGRGSL